MLVEVRPLDIKKWHEKKGKDAFAQPKTLEVLVSGSTRKYQTGMSEEETAKYSKILGVDLSDRFDPDEPHPFWSKKASWITLPVHTVVFDTSIPSDFVKVRNLKASSKVANSMEAWERGEYPEATHVIYDEQEEVAIKAAKIQLRQKATLMLPKMTTEDKVSLVTILSDKNTTVKGASENLVNVEIADLIENKPSEFIKFAEMGREEVSLRAKVLDLSYKNILTKEGSAYFYMGDLIGLDYENTISWFKDPNNQKMKVMILEKLEKVS